MEPCTMIDAWVQVLVNQVEREIFAKLPETVEITIHIYIDTPYGPRTNEPGDMHRLKLGETKIEAKSTTTVGEIKDHLLENMPMLEYSKIEIEFWCPDVPDAFNVQGICCGLGQSFMKMNICSRSPAFMKVYKYLVDMGEDRQKAKYQAKSILLEDLGLDMNLHPDYTLKLSKKRKRLCWIKENVNGFFKETITFLRDDNIVAAEDTDVTLQGDEYSLECRATREQDSLQGDESSLECRGTTEQDSLQGDESSLECRATREQDSLQGDEPSLECLTTREQDSLQGDEPSLECRATREQDSLLQGDEYSLECRATREQDSLQGDEPSLKCLTTRVQDSLQGDEYSLECRATREQDSLQGDEYSLECLSTREQDSLQGDEYSLECQATREQDSLQGDEYSLECRATREQDSLQGDEYSLECLSTREQDSLQGDEYSLECQATREQDSLQGDEYSLECRATREQDSLQGDEYSLECRATREQDSLQGDEYSLECQATREHDSLQGDEYSLECRATREQDSLQDDEPSLECLTTREQDSLQGDESSLDCLTTSEQDSLQGDESSLDCLTTSEQDSLQGDESSLECLTTREQRLDDLEQQIKWREKQISLREQYLNERNQEALLADVEIVNVPEEQDEDVVYTVMLVASMLGVEIMPCEVVFAVRVGVARGATGREARRRIVVRLTSRNLRNQLLKCARARPLPTAELYLAVASIYINERLTDTNKQLFHQVRLECRRLRWRYSWTKNGRIYAREANETPVFRIQTAADIERVFGLPSVSQ